MWTILSNKYTYLFEQYDLRSLFLVSIAKIISSFVRVLSGKLCLYSWSFFRCLFWESRKSSYSSAIQLEITRPLDPKNLKANLRFLEERRYNDIIRALNEDTCIVQHENGEVTHVRSWSFLFLEVLVFKKLIDFTGLNILILMNYDLNRKHFQAKVVKNAWSCEIENWDLITNRILLDFQFVEIQLWLYNCPLKVTIMVVSF